MNVLIYISREKKSIENNASKKKKEKYRPLDKSIDKSAKINKEIISKFLLIKIE